MATPFRLKRSAVADRRPTTTDLQLGELALNTHDGFLYAETTGVGSTVSLLTPWREQYGSPTSIYYNHRVGIGSTNPTVSLDVVGDTILQSNLDVAGIATIGSGGSGQTILQYQGLTRLTTQSWGVQGTGTVQSIGDLQAVNVGSQTDGKNIHITNLKSGGGTKNVLTLSHTSNNSFITGHVGNISINAPQVSISTNFSVGGISTFTNTVNINGVIEANSNLNVDGNLDVDGRTELDITNISETLRVVGVSTFAGITTVTGETLFTKQLNVSGVSTFKDNSIIEGSLTVGSATGITGGAPTDQGNLAVYGNGRNSLIIQAGNNNQDRGMAFRNNGDYYVAHISAINMGSSTAAVSYTHLTLPTKRIV